MQPDTERPEGMDTSTGIEAPADDGALRIGDPAPPLSAERWFRGEQREAVTPGRITILDFWATWCGPCITVMPHLSELAERHGDDGLDVIGVSIDTGTNAEGLVERFLDNRGEIVRFDVMLADAGMRARWFDAAGRTSIPTSMVVDGEGTVVWIGHPSELTGDGGRMLDGLIVGLLEGSYDPGAAIEAERARLLHSARMDEDLAAMNEAWMRGDMEGAIEAIDRIVAGAPDMYGDLALRKGEILLFELGDAARAVGYVRDAAGGLYADDPGMRLAFASLLGGEADPGPDGRALSIELASAEVARSDGTEPDALVVLAECHFAAGNVDEAIGTIDAAMRLVGETHPAYSTYELVRLRYTRARSDAEASATEGGG